MSGWIWIPAVLAAGLLVAELVCRAMLRRGGYYVWKPGARMRLQIDREALPRLSPEARFWINSAGERNLASPPPDDSDTFRVVVCGGSAVECYFLDDSESWGGQLQQRLRRPETLERLGRGDAYVGNIGRSGTGPSEAVAKLLDKIAPRYQRLDVIGIMIGAADIVNWMRHGCPVPMQPELTTDEVFLQHPESPFGWAPKRTAIYETARRWNSGREETVRERVGKKLLEVRAMRANAERVKTATPEPTPMVDRYVSWLRKAIRRGLQIADRVIVIQQPWFGKDWTDAERAQLWNFAEGYPYAEHVTTYYSLDVARDLMELLAKEGGRVALEEGAETLDVMPLLEPSLDVFYDFIHLTSRGSKTLADALHDMILKPGPKTL